MRKLLEWIKLNPKKAILLYAVAMVPLILIVNYTLLILGVITADEFATINTNLINFLKALLLFA